MKAIGPSFEIELKAAGLLGLPFSWGGDGSIQFSPDMTQSQKDAVLAVYDSHDPASTFAIDKIKALEKYRADRERMVNRVSIIAGRAAREGNAAKATACDALIDTLTLIPKHATVVAATNITDLNQAMEDLYDTAVYAALIAHPSLKQDFKNMDS